jgi:hypothetical protein
VCVAGLPDLSWLFEGFYDSGSKVGAHKFKAPLLKKRGFLFNKILLYIGIAVVSW